MQHIYEQVRLDPRFHVLETKRRHLSWGLAAVVLANDCWYVFATAFFPEMAFARFWGTPIGPGYATTWGIVIGICQTILFVILVGYYTYRANGEFDDLTASIVADATRKAGP